MQQKELAEVQQLMESEHPSEQKLQEVQFQGQQKFEDVVRTESPKFATANVKSVSHWWPQSQLNASSASDSSGNGDNACSNSRPTQPKLISKLKRFSSF